MVNVCYLACIGCDAQPDHDWTAGNGLAVATYKLLAPQSFFGDGSIYDAYMLIEALHGRGSSWLTNLGQYGCRELSYAGYQVVEDGSYQHPEQYASGPNCVVFHFTDNLPEGPYCGWHSAGPGGSPYAAIYRPRAETHCILGSERDSLLSVVSHELAEALTDPIPGVTGNSGAGGEVGDEPECSWHFARVRCADGKWRTAQYIWSQADGDCWPALTGEAQ